MAFLHPVQAYVFWRVYECGCKVTWEEFLSWYEAAVQMARMQYRNSFSKRIFCADCNQQRQCRMVSKGTKADPSTPARS